MKVNLGTLKRLSPRDVWKHEAKDFTPWLAENIGQLADILGLDLELIETEPSVGTFSVDIVARDLSSGNLVVIENQFGETNHDHLGKLLTYASGIDAYALVWVSESFKDEHKQALEWINERTDEDTSLFGLELEVLQIDSSAPAFNLKPIVVPNKWQKATRIGTRGGSPRSEAYRDFFQQLIDELREKHHFTRARVAFAQNWYSFTSGIRGVSYGASFAQGERMRVEVYLDRGDSKENKNMFDWLGSRKEQIESKLGASLQWERLDDRRASRVALYRPGSIDNDEANLAEIRSWAVNQLLAFKDVFGLLLKEYGK